MIYTFFSAFVLLILICDPIGNIPVFASVIKNVPYERRWKIIVREHLVSFFILIFFLLVGKAVLSAIGLTTNSLQIAGAIILFLIALRMIFPQPTLNEIDQEQEPFIVPLAVPLVAGPSAIAAVMIFASQQPDNLLTWVGVITLTIMTSMTILLIANRIQRSLDTRIIVAMEKLMGLILVAIAVEMISQGLHNILS